MAIVSGTGIRTTFKGQRESLHNSIFRISPERVPFSSAAGVGPKAKSITEEWQTDALAAADGTNAQLEGDDTSFSTPAATVRVGNIAQILNKSVILSDTLEDLDYAGRKSALAFEVMKRGKEIKRDWETVLLRSQAGASGSSTVARTLAGLNSWVKTNESVGTGGVAPVYTSGVPGAVRTDGTQRAFTETIAKAVIQSGYTAGAEMNTIMVGPYNKTVFSSFSGQVTRNFDQSNVSPSPTAVIASADVYVSDFGTLRVIPNLFQRERDAWFLDFGMVETRFLRALKVKKLGKSGDAEKRLMVMEGTLIVKQEAGLGIAADLNVS
jgi:hypothetical protein